MALLKVLLLRLGLWVALPLLLIALIVGPKRFLYLLRRGWDWLFARRLEPEVILGQVVTQHQQHVKSVRDAVSQAELAEAELVRGLEASQKTMAELEEEARLHVELGDELGAKGALYKLNLERTAANNFEEQLGEQRSLIAESRKRLYTLELQLRQYEVGRSILLSQLAQAKGLEQQYEIATQFDPFNAIANWEKAEALVDQQAAHAHAKERVYNDTAELAIAHTVDIDPALLEAQLAELRQLCNDSQQQLNDRPGLRALSAGSQEAKKNKHAQ